MAQVQKVSWRTVGYAALGTAAIIAGTVGIVRSDGVRPTALKSNASTRWLVDQINHRLVLADGLTGRVLARILTESESGAQVAAQGAGGAFLASPEDGTVRTISTAKLALGAPQRVSPLADLTDVDAVEYGVGVNGLTVVNTSTDEAGLVSGDDSPRSIDVPQSDQAFVARDGSMWLFAGTSATHVTVDGTRRTFEVRGSRSVTATVGTHAVYLDRPAGVVHWLEGGEVPVDSIPNVADAILQVPRGDDASCVWLAASGTVACIGKTGIEKQKQVPGLAINPGDRLAVAANVAVLIRANNNQVDRIDLDTGRILTGGDPFPPSGHDLRVVSINKMVWIDDTDGTLAWAVHSLGFETIDKADENAFLYNAQGQVEQEGAGEGGESPTGGGAPGETNASDHRDTNGREDKPVAVDDSVTARAGNTVNVPVTANDWDPDGQAIALVSVSDGQQAGHGTTDVLNGSSLAYVPVPGFSGVDSFEYTIVDEVGNTDVGKVTIELFPPDSPNRPPITQRDHARTRAGHPVTIDVLANDIDPERDLLSLPTFAQPKAGTVTETVGPTGLPALKFTPPPNALGAYTFTYQAADTLGGVSADTEVTVAVLPSDAPNEVPVAEPDAIRLRVGSTGNLNVLANDWDPDGDDLTIEVADQPQGVTARVVGQQLAITMRASAENSSVVLYTLSDGDHETEGRVLVLKIADSAPNRPPVANPDFDRVVIGQSIKVDVLSNDIDPESDRIRLLTAEDPPGGVGTAKVEGDFVRFTPNLPDIEESTPVTFAYRIGDGHGNTAVGNVSITVLAEPLPRDPVAQDDLVETDAGKPTTIDVLFNDSDPNGGRPHLLGDAVCISGGTAVATAEEKITFTPPIDETGGHVYRCQYTVVGSRGQAKAWIIVTVKPVTLGNHDPFMVQGAINQSIPAGSSITFSANVVADDDDGDDLQFVLVGRPSYGSTNFDQPSSTFTYTAPASPASEIPLPVNLTVQISDGHGGLASGQLSITVIDNSPKPPAAPATHQIDRAVEVDNQVDVDVLSDLRLMPANQGLTLSLVGAKAETTGQADVTANTSSGIVSITPHVTGTVRVTYTVQNADLTKSGTIVVAVSEKPVVNNPPVAVDDELAVASGGSGSVDLLRNDGGITDPGDSAQATLMFPPPTSFGSVKVVNGTLTLVANPDYPGGSVTVPYNLSDGSGQSDTGSVALRIEACTDSPPVAQSATTFTPYMTPINIDLGTLVTSGNIVTSSIHGAGLTGPTGTYAPPAGKNDSETVTFDVVNACNQVAHGSLVIDVNRAPTALPTSLNVSPGQVQTLVPTNIADDDEALTITALQGQPDWVTRAADGSSITAAPPSGVPSNSYTFTATVEDPGGLSTTTTITVTVNNTAPTAVDDVYATGLAILTIDPTLNDFDAEPGQLRIYTVAPDPQPTDAPGAQVVSHTDTTVLVNVGHGVSHFSYTIIDAGGLTASATITITSNRAPTAADVSGSTNQPTVIVDFTASDPDGDDIEIDCSPPVGSSGWQIDALDNPSPPPTVWLHVTIPPDAPRPSTQQFTCTVTDRPPAGTPSLQTTATVTLTLT